MQDRHGRTKPAPGDGTPAPTCPEELLLQSPAGSPAGTAAEGLPDGCLEVYRERELDRFAGILSGKGASKLQSEWHKPGAPRMDEAAEGAGPGAAASDAAGRTSARATENAPSAKAAATRPPVPAGAERTAGGKADPDESPYVVPPGLSGGGGSGTGGSSGGSRLADFIKTVQGSRLAGAVDLTTLEITALTMFRALFGQGVAIPIKREGLVDMDIVVMGKDIVFNTNRLMLELPELTIWRVIFSYKGQPILEYGRGVPRKIKIHKIRALMLLAGMWWHGLTSRNAQSERISGRAMALMTRRDERKKVKKHTRAGKAAGESVAGEVAAAGGVTDPPPD